LALRTFWRSREYADIKPLRTGAADVEVWAVPAQ
jgi:uncharacterized protein (DUF1330 family)